MNGQGEDIQVLRVSEIGSFEKKEWVRLWQSDAVSQNPFMSPYWALAVSQYLVTTEVAIIRRRGRVVAVLPFDRGANGRGGPVGRILSDGDGVLFEHGIELDARAIVRACGLRSLSFIHKPSRPDPLHQFEENVHFSAHVDLGFGFENYRERRESSGTEVFKVSERKRRKLSREKGEVHFELRSNDGSVVTNLVEWKAKQLCSQGHSTFMSNADWIVPLLEGLDGQLNVGLESVLSGLYVNGRLIAAHWGLRSNELLVSAVPSFDPEFSHYSPGLLLSVELLRHAAQDGASHVELGLGLNQMKTSLMTGSQPLASGVVDATSLGYLLRRGRRWAPRPVIRAAKALKRISS